MPGSVTVLDDEKWAKRARLLDFFTLGLLVVVGISLIRDAYNLGLAATGPFPGGHVNRLLLDVFLGVLALAWLAYRLLRAAAHPAGARPA